MIILKILRFILPPFHPLKYKYISWWWSEQATDGGWKDCKIIKKNKNITGELQ